MKKSLSILLALLMILSSLPIMTFAASAEQADPNVMADYTYADWQTRRWGSSNQGTESLNGGNSIYLKSVNYQKAFTTVTLQPNTTYFLDFNWKSDTNEDLNGIFLRNLFIFAESTYGSNEALLAPAPSTALESYAGSGSWHHDDGAFYPAGATGTLTSLGADLESETADYTSRQNAAAGTWQHIATKFTTNSTDTEYAIMVDFQFNSTGNAGPNAIHLSDFRLITTADSESIAIEDKTANDWYPFQHSKIYDDATFTQDGITSDFRVEKPVYQKISTVVELDPYTTYTFDFDYYGVVHEKGNPYISSIRVFDYASGSVLDANNWTLEGDYNKSYTDIENGSYGSADNAGSWQHVATTFTTTAATKYNITICFNASGFDNAQKVYLANFELDTLVAKKPGNILNNATYANGDVSWTTATGQNMDARMSFASGLDNPAFSVNGGYAWGFGFGYGDLVGDNYGYVYIKAKGLKANATYDFSYIYVNDFRFKIDSIKSGDNTVTNYIVEPTIETMADYKAEKVSTMFTVPVDGDYVIALKSNRDPDYRMSWITWSTTYLCDLELYARGAMYDVSVSKEGNGFAKADTTGLTEEGTSVTFTAKAETYEQFLGWYVGDELVSEDLTYTATVEGALAPVAKFTTNSENLMADYTASNFGAEPNGTVSDSTETNYGGNGVYAAKVPHQNFFTTVTLEAGKNYTFGFNWKSEANIYNKLYPNTISVFQKAAGDPFDASSWDDSKWPPYQGDTTTYPDIESGGPYTTQDLANTCTWQSVTTGFTPTETTEYVIMIALTFAMQDTGDGQGTVHHNNNQGIYFSDFVLKEEYVDESNIVGQLTASDWATWNYSRVSDYGDSRYGGKAYYVDRSMYQSIATELALKPGTDYEFSFQWKAVANENGNAYPAGLGVYSANSGTIPPAKTLYNNTEAESPYPANGYANLAQNVTFPELETAVLTEWNTLSGNFTTAEDANYYFTLYFNRDGSANNDQKLIISDFVLKEVVKGDAPAGDDMIAHPGVSIRKNTESVYGQALRYKFTVDGDVIANAQTDGYELVEYGTVVALNDELAGHAADPILNATAYTVKSGVAYNVDDGTNIQFAVDDNGDVTYTAALYNIPITKYDATFAVRPYAKFRNADGDTYIRYGTTRYSCVFDVVKAVLAGTNDDDKAYVNNTLLAGNIKTAYDAWLAE